MAPALTPYVYMWVCDAIYERRRCRIVSLTQSAMLPIRCGFAASYCRKIVSYSFGREERTRNENECNCGCAGMGGGKAEGYKTAERLPNGT